MMEMVLGNPSQRGNNPRGDETYVDLGSVASAGSRIVRSPVRGGEGRRNASVCANGEAKTA